MLRKFVLSFIIADNFINNLIKRPFKKMWKLEGACNKCGRCCQDIGLEINPKMLRSKFVTNIIIRWISWAFDFYLKRIEHDRFLLFFGCRNVKEDGTCSVYKWRPNICRNYPIQDYFEQPALFDTCGYKTKLN